MKNHNQAEGTLWVYFPANCCTLLHLLEGWFSYTQQALKLLIQGIVLDKISGVFKYLHTLLAKYTRRVCALFHKCTECNPWRYLPAILIYTLSEWRVAYSISWYWTKPVSVALLNVQPGRNKIAELYEVATNDIRTTSNITLGDITCYWLSYTNWDKSTGRRINTLKHRACETWRILIVMQLEAYHVRFNGIYTTSLLKSTTWN
jgi:hypothetical protein